MKIIKKQYFSPSIPNKLRDLLIIEPDHISDQSPVLFFYDGHVLKTGETNFNTETGIDICKLAPNAIIIALSTIDDTEKNKWKMRAKQLCHQDNGKYSWNLLVQNIVTSYQKKYQGKWYGFGFSLSGAIIWENQKLFSKVIAISPFFTPKLPNKKYQGLIFYGAKEYLKKARAKINLPIKHFCKQYPDVKAYKIKNMVHDFYSWSNHFAYILKQSLDFQRFGYLNYVKEQNGYYVRQSSKQFSNWKNEKLILTTLNIPFEFKNNILKRPWLPGEIVTNWNTKLLKQLKIAIAKLHQLKITNLSKHDWMKYQQYKHKISKQNWLKFQKLVQKYENDKLVVSHNDINHQNLLVYKNKITLIDYEWANLNHPYFDYVQFYIAENIRIDDLEENIFQEWLFICLIYFILWTYKMPQNKQVLSWRKQYLQKLS